MRRPCACPTGTATGTAHITTVHCTPLKKGTGSPRRILHERVIPPHRRHCSGGGSSVGSGGFAPPARSTAASDAMKATMLQSKPSLCICGGGAVVGRRWWGGDAATMVDETTIKMVRPPLRNQPQQVRAGAYHLWEASAIFAGASSYLRPPAPPAAADPSRLRPMAGPPAAGPKRPRSPRDRRGCGRAKGA